MQGSFVSYDVSQDRYRIANGIWSDSVAISSKPKENILPLDHQMPERNLEEFSFVMIVL